MSLPSFTRGEPENFGLSARELEVSRTNADAWAWVWLAVAGFVIGQIAAALFLDLWANLHGEGSQLQKFASLSEPPEWYIVTSLVGLWVGLLGATFIATWWRGTHQWRTDFGVHFRVVDLWGVAVGVGGQYLIALLYLPFIKHLHNFTAPAKRLTGGAHGNGEVVIGILTIVFAPFVEEVFFRGMLLRGLRKLFSNVREFRFVPLGMILAIVVDGLCFAGAHGELAQFGGLSVFGCILAYISWRTGRQGMNIVAHGAFNMVAVIATFSASGVVVH